MKCTVQCTWHFSSFRIQQLVLGTLLDDESLLEFAKFGVYCQFDLFGIECSLYQLSMETDMPSDAQRMQKVLRLIKEGYEDRILLSHDIHTKHRLVSFIESIH